MLAFNQATSIDFGAASEADSASTTIKVRTSTGGDFLPLLVVQADRAFNLTLAGGDQITVTPIDALGVLPPVSVEWMLHGGVAIGRGISGCKVFDDLEVGATATVLKGATLALAGARSGTLFTVEGGTFNAYLLRGRVISLPGACEVAFTISALRAPSSGGGVTVQVGGLSG